VSRYNRRPSLRIVGAPDGSVVIVEAVENIAVRMTVAATGADGNQSKLGADGIRNSPALEVLLA
jgi:hypothetical protein